MEAVRVLKLAHILMSTLQIHEPERVMLPNAGSSALRVPVTHCHWKPRPLRPLQGNYRPLYGSVKTNQGT
jgi:hypothetical protein